jgi:hypothetical protein
MVEHYFKTLNGRLGGREMGSVHHLIKQASERDKPTQKPHISFLVCTVKQLVV